MEMRDAARHGALYGAQLWLTFAAVGCWLLGIVPWLMQPAWAYRPLHPGLTALLFVLYPLAGALSGAAAATVVRMILRAEPDRERFDEAVKAAAVFTLLLAYATNAIVLIPVKSELVAPLASAALIAVGLGLMALRLPGTRRLRILLNPVCASLLLAGLSWITKDLLRYEPRTTKLSAGVAWWIAAPALAWALTRVWPSRLRRSAWWIGALATFALSATAQSGPKISAASGTTPARRSGPSVVLITMDTVRADHLSVYGYPADTSPALKALAARATLYTHAMSAADTTLASHASMFSGRYPSQHGAHNEHDSALPRPIDPGVPLLAAQLAAAGYRTLGVVANYGNLGTGVGLDRGFQYYDQRTAVRFLLDDPPHNHFLRQGASRILQLLTGTDLAQVPYRRANDINRAVLPLLDQRKADGRPFFLFVNYMDAHWPYRPPPPFDTKFGGTRARAIAKADYYQMASDVMAGRRRLTDAEHADLVSQYDGGIATVDQRIGELVERLDRLDLFDDCLVIVTADHGEAFGEHTLMEHGVSVYADQIHVPLIVKYPAQRTPRVVRDAVSGIDVMATVLDVAGHPAPAGVEGRSLARDPENPASSRVVFSESYPDAGLYDTNPRFRRIERAVVSGGVKLIVSTAGKRELYDLDDSQDAHDLAADRPEVAQGLDRLVNQWLATVTQPEGTVRPLDPRTVDRLKSLGYVR